MQNVYWELGHDPEPRTTLVGAPGGTVHITSPSRVEVTGDPKQGGTLEFTNDFAPPDPYYVLIMPIGRPEQVLLDGKEIAFNAQLEKASESAARYTPSTGMLVIKVMKPGLTSLSVAPVKRVEATLSARPVKEIAFQFDQDDEGWFPSHDAELIGVANGVATFKITGGDPYLVRGSLDVEAAKVKGLVIRMKVSGGSTGQVYWSTKESPAIAEDKDVRFDVKADGQFHEYRVNMAAHPLWTDTVTSLRLDPTNGKEAAGTTVEIDYIKAE
jgi:hypothetical protein